MDEFETWYNTAFIGDPTDHLHDGKVHIISPHNYVHTYIVVWIARFDFLFVHNYFSIP